MRNLTQKSLLTLLLPLFLLLLFLLPSTAAAEETLEPWWHVSSTSRPSNIAPGPGVGGTLVVTAENVGGELAYARNSHVRILDTLPAGLRAVGTPVATNALGSSTGLVPCQIEAVSGRAGARVSCTYSGRNTEEPSGAFTVSEIGDIGGVPPFAELELRIDVEAQPGAVTCQPGASDCEENEVSVSGGEGAHCVKAKTLGQGAFAQSNCSEPTIGGNYELRFSGAMPGASVRRPVVIDPQAPSFGVQSYEFTPEEVGGAADTQAGSHPFQVNFNLVLDQDQEGEEGGNGDEPKPIVHPVSLAHAVRVKLPPGFVGDPSAVPTCSVAQFLTLRNATSLSGGGYANECPDSAVVGVATVTFYAPNIIGETTESYPVYNVEPQRGEPARFGFLVTLTGTGVYIDTALRSGGDYGVTSISGNIAQSVAFASSNVTIWGVPGDARHDSVRGWSCLAANTEIEQKLIEYTAGTCTALGERQPPPFLDLPTSCTGPLQTSIEADSWQDEGSFVSTPSEPVAGMTGCNQLQFVPEIEVTPDGHEASKPTGLTVDVHVPQEGQLNGKGLAQSNIKGIEVTLPAGVSLNPSAADGLQACTGNEGDAPGGRLGVPGNEIGYKGSEEFNPGSEPGNKTPTFTPYKPESVDAKANGYKEGLEPGTNFCPDASKVATVKIKTPLLPNPLEGAIYLASPQNFEVFPPENPFEKHVAMYLVAEDPVSGSFVKLPGWVELGGEPKAKAGGELAPGQIRSYFEDNPQLPFEDAEVHFFGGERAPLATPDHCGTYTTQAIYTPWDGGAPVTSYSSFHITSGPGGGPCPGPSLPFHPTSTGGALNLNAGAFSPFTTTLSRAAGEQELASAEVRLPPGLSGILSGVELCREPQADEGTCGPNSQIGETTVSVGVGGEPFTVTGGKVYITGPYDGTSECATPGVGGCASFGLSVVNPAKAGPFVLKHGKPVVVRAKIEINPYTSALTVTSNPPGTPYSIPTIIEGFPLQIEHVNITTTRNDFQFNPTNCSKMQVEASLHAAEGGSDEIKVPFQVTNCASLKFTPKFTVSTSGKTSKARGASLVSKVTEPNEPQGSQANIAKVKVELPLQLPSRLTTLQKACLAKVFEANPAACPPASNIGHALVHTPLLPVPLEGPAIFVSHGNEAFPSLEIVLQGYGVNVILVGSTYISPKGITSTTFKTVPDQPFNTFELTLPEGPYSALAANGNLCKLTTTKTVKKKVKLKRHGHVVRKHGHAVYVKRKVKEKVPTSLIMPNEFIAQNGAAIHEQTHIAVTGCPKAHKAVKKKKHKKKKGAKHKR